MTDFLDALLAKTTAQPAAVRPRPLALFEPLPAAGSLAAPGPALPDRGDSLLGREQLSDELSADESGDLRVAEPSVDAHQRRPRAGLRPLPSEPHGLANAAPPGRSSPASSALPGSEMPPAAARQIQTASPPARVPDTGRPEPARSLPPASSWTSVNPPPPDFASPAPSPAQPAIRPGDGPGQAALAPAAAQPQPASRPAEIRSQPAGEALRPAGSTAAPESTPDATVRIQPGGPPLPAGSRTSTDLPAVAGRHGARRDLPAEAAAPPVIQVSIGRIEVRAAPPPQPAPRSRPPGPSVNLDDYLRRRSGDRK